MKRYLRLYNLQFCIHLEQTAFSGSVSEALGAHIHAVSCLCGCDVSVTEAFELHGEEIVERE